MALKLRSIVKFPARVLGEAGIAISKLAGVYTFFLRFRDFAPAPVDLDTSLQEAIIFQRGIAEDGSDDVYQTLPLLQLAAARYGGTSTTSLLIAAASKAFATQMGLAYQVGARVRASSAADPTNYMEGVVTDYTGGALTVDVDQIGGSGTFADWNFNIAGEPGGAFLQSGTGAVSRTMQDKARESVSVKDFGAVGNGVTDDTIALQAAFTAAATAKKLIVTPGDYIVSDELSITGDNVEVVFERGARFAAAASADASPHMLSAANISGLRLIGATLVGNGVPPVSTPGSAPAGMYFGGCEDISIEYADMTGFMGIGIVLSNCLTSRVLKGRFVNMGENQAGEPSKIAVPAIWVGNGGKYAVIKDNYFENCQFSAVFLFSSDSLVEGNTAYNNFESAFYSENIDPATNNGVEVRRNKFVNNVVDTTTIVDISACGFEVTTHDTIVSNNTVVNCGSNGIVVGLASRIVVTGNTIRNCNSQNDALGSGIAVTIHSGVYNGPSTQGDSIVVSNNTIFDETGHCLYGILWYCPDPTTYLYHRANCQGNVIQGMVTADIRVDPNSMPGTTMLGYGGVIANNSGWPDRVVDATSGSSNALAVTTIKSYVVPAHSMLDQGGLRITAWGTFTGTLPKIARLEFGGFSGFSDASGTGTESWRIEGLVFNTNASSQTLHTVSWVNNTMQRNLNSTKSVDTTADVTVYVTGETSTTADTVVCKGLIVERI